MHFSASVNQGLSSTLWLTPFQTVYCSDLFLLKEHAPLLPPVCSSFKENCRCLSFFHFYDGFHFHLPCCSNNWILSALLNRIPVVIIAPTAHSLEELIPSVASPQRRLTGLQKVTQSLYPILLDQAYRQTS